MNRLVSLPEPGDITAAAQQATPQPGRAKTSRLELSISRGRGTFQFRLHIGREHTPADVAAGNDATQLTATTARLPGTIIVEDAGRIAIANGAPPGLPAADTGSPLRGQNCTVVYTDIVGFGDARRTEHDRLVIRQASAIMTMTALGPLWDACSWGDRGDGMLIIVPPDIPTTAVLDRLLTTLPGELGDHNSRHGAGARLQMRVAIEVGPVVTDSIGVSGEAIILAARMLEVPSLKRAIAKAGSPLGIITSAFVFDTAIRNAGQPLCAADYMSVQVKVKNTRIAAWFRLVD